MKPNYHMRLYDISSQYLKLLAALDDDAEEYTPVESVLKDLENISDTFDNKMASVAAYARTLEAEAEAIKDAALKMEVRAGALNHRAKELRFYVKGQIEKMGTKVKHPWFVLSVQRNPGALDIFDEESIPARYKVEQRIMTIDRAAVKEDLKKGEAIAGAVLTHGTRLVIR